MVFCSPRNQWSEMGPYLGHEVSVPIFVSKKNNGRFRNTPWTVESISLRQVPSYQDSTCLDGTFVACLEMISSAAKIIMKKSYNHQSYHHPWNSKEHFKKCVFHQVDDFFEVGNFWSSKIGDYEFDSVWFPGNQYFVKSLFLQTRWSIGKGTQQEPQKWLVEG